MRMSKLIVLRKILHLSWFCWFSNNNQKSLQEASHAYWNYMKNRAKMEIFMLILWFKFQLIKATVN